MITLTVNERFAESLGNAIRFWEVARIPYNFALVVTILAVVGVNRVLEINIVDFLALGFLGVVANIVYCASYLPDLFLQMSDLSKRNILAFRLGIWLTGTGFAMILAFFSFIDGAFIWNELIK